MVSVFSLSICLLVYPFFLHNEHLNQGFTSEGFNTLFTHVDWLVSTFVTCFHRCLNCNTYYEYEFFYRNSIRTVHTVVPILALELVVTEKNFVFGAVITHCYTYILRCPSTKSTLIFFSIRILTIITPPSVLANVDCLVSTFVTTCFHYDCVC